MTDETQIKLILKDVTKVFEEEQGKGVTAVDHVNLEVHKGEMVIFLGPSGSGKTTLLRIIAGLEECDAGAIILDGHDITHLLPNKRNLGFMFQDYALFPHMDVYENISYGLKIKRVRHDQIRKLVGEVVELVGLQGLERRKVTALSGGQQQRVALARAIVVKPSVLLFDEPLSNLDAKLRVQMRTELRNLQKAVSITSLYVTHDQDEAMSMADRIAVIGTGQLYQIGPPEEIYLHPNNRFVADFIGSANFILMDVEEVGNNIIKLRTPDNALSLALSREHIGRQEYRLNEDKQVTVLIRPEAILLGEKQEDSDSASIGTIKSVAYLGNRINYEIDYANYTFKATSYIPYVTPAMRQQGANVTVRIRTDLVSILPEGNSENNER